MTKHQGFPELDGIVYYRAPKDRRVNPALIAQNTECIEILTGGRVWHDDESGGRYYGRGTIFRHAPGDYTVHLADLENPYRCLALRFSGIDSQKRYPRISRWITMETLSIFRRQVLSAFHNPDYDRTILRDYIWSTVNWHTFQSRSLSGSEDMPGPLRQALSYLNSHPEANISIEHLATMTRYSKAHFHNLFKKYLGTTPHNYHLRMRISLSCQELATSTRTIPEIGTMYGFESLENFYRAFRRLVGKTPAEYRREHSLLT